MTRQRNTRQRSAIEEVFAKTHRPLTPGEVHAYARGAVPALGIATVYRALSMMVEEKKLRAVELPGQPPRFEKTGLGHHHHFHCIACDKVYDLDGCLLRKDLVLPEGFELQGHDITLSGRCSDCGKPA